MPSKDTISLKPGTLIDDYRLIKTLGGGGFSIVYLARHRLTSKQFAIKEYMPSKLCQRNADGSVEACSSDVESSLSRGRKLFFQEANALANLKHQNIVNVVNFFRDNGTVYMVMEYHHGQNLQMYLKQRKGGLSEAFIRIVFNRLLDGLEMIHGNDLLHLDIKPGNIHIRPGGQPLLLDFGAVHGFPQARKAQPGQVISPGFSPIEQYDNQGYVGPWTDLYAFGATMRSCIEGKSPQPADERQQGEKLKPVCELYKKRYTANLLQAIDWAMEMDPMLRPQSVNEFRDMLSTEKKPEKTSSTLERLASSLLGNKD
ncbi:MAG: serine/threonine-protein kinase [Gammaproteobacteria bacterium]